MSLEHELDFRVGGQERVYEEGREGKPALFESVYQDIVPNERIVYTSTLFTDDRLATVYTLVQQRVPAPAVKDAAAVTSHYADDVVLFDVVGPLCQVGAGAHADRVIEWLSLYRDGIEYLVRDLSITAGNDTAFCHYLYRAGGTMTDGTPVGMWVRSTICFRKIDGDWIITHEHTSVPFDGATGLAPLDLQPD